LICFVLPCLSDQPKTVATSRDPLVF
jgi:hypothetical protein